MSQSSGNKCHHNPLNPKSFTIPDGFTRPRTLANLIDKVKNSYKDPEKYKAIYYRSKSPEKQRKVRSEFREVISAGISILTYYYDVVTGKIGFEDKNSKWVSLSYKQLSIKLDISLARIKRFFVYMQQKGFIEVEQRRKTDERGHWFSNVSIKTIKPIFYITFFGAKVWDKIKLLKEWKLKKLMKSKPHTEENRQNFSALQDVISSQPKKLFNTVPNCVPRSANSIEQEKSLIRRAMDLFKLDSSRSMSDYLRELKTA